MSYTRQLALTILLSLTTLFTYAEGIDKTAADFFVAMPDEEAEYLNMSLKGEMVELYKIGTSSKTRNLLGGESWISHMDTTRIDAVLAAEKCLMTIKTYKNKQGKQLYTVVKTLYTPIADSEIQFFNGEMEKLNSKKLFEYPKFKDFFAKPSDKELRKIMERITMMFIKIEVAEEGTLLVTLDDMWLDILESNISNKLLQLKKKTPLCYKWSKKRFKWVES